MDVIETGIDFWNKMYEAKELTIKFRKKDGTTRIMRATLDFTKIPKEDYPQRNINIPKIIKNLQKNKIIRVYDLEKMGWRSIPIDRVEYVKIGSKQYKVIIGKPYNVHEI